MANLKRANNQLNKRPSVDALSRFSQRIRLADDCAKLDAKISNPPSQAV